MQYLTSEHTHSTHIHEVKSVEKTTCCIVGGGPAGAVLSLLLARKGIPVTLLEAHMDFDREFRGDTIHPVEPHHPVGEHRTPFLSRITGFLESGMQDTFFAR